MWKRKKKKYELAEHFLRLLLRCWLCVKMWRMWWVRFVHSKDDLVGTCILSNHLSHLVMFCRPAVCERHQEGWVQMPAVAWYLFSLQSLQNQGGTLLLEDEMEEGHCLQYKRLFFCKVLTSSSIWWLSNILQNMPIIFQVGAKSFIIPNDKDIYCVPCFEDKVFMRKVALLVLITFDRRSQPNARSAKGS